MSTLHRLVGEIPLHAVVAQGPGHLPAHTSPEVSVVDAVIQPGLCSVTHPPFRHLETSRLPTALQHLPTILLRHTFLPLVRCGTITLRTSNRKFLLLTAPEDTAMPYDRRSICDVVNRVIRKRPVIPTGITGRLILISDTLGYIASPSVTAVPSTATSSSSPPPRDW
jgi:hypothetical protein